MKLDGNEREFFDSYAEKCRAYTEEQITGTASILEACESPLEQRFLLALLYYYSDFGPLFVYDLEGERACYADLDYAGFLRIEVQRTLEFEGRKIRPDFILSFQTRAPLTTHLKLAIEIDGHDFHERTKQQAQRDKSKDRLLVTNGYTVMRFTGSEVFRDTGPLVLQVSSFIQKAVNDFAAAHGFNAAAPLTPEQPNE